MSNSSVNVEAVKSDIRCAVINQKANVCPMTIRLAWHASGTFDKNDNSGGSNGATMRFEPEKSDPANSGLGIIRDLLQPVILKHPEVSIADIWALAGCHAIEFAGGPSVPFSFGRTDAVNGSRCPQHGRLPDASQGAQHLRDVFYRMGFNDQEIVALSGAHTLGRCHQVRSGYDGPWTRTPLKFDNMFFRNLVHLKWKKRNWDGPEQFTDEETEELMMLPTDIALIRDAKFRVFVEAYAKDQELFFKDFARVFAKLIALGVPHQISEPVSEQGRKNAEFREFAMHGSVPSMRKIWKQVDVQELERSSGRTALHKAAFFGHDDAIRFLVQECKCSLNVQDYNGDTALHDAARFGHLGCVKWLVTAGANLTTRNHANKDAIETARDYGHQEIVEYFQNPNSSKF